MQKKQSRYQDALAVRRGRLSDMEKRDVVMSFRVTPSEAKRIKDRMKDAGVRKPGAFLRKMAVDGYIIRLDLEELREATRLMRITSNNLNQYAKKANETGSIYETDVKEIKKNQEGLWELLNGILERLSTIR